MEVDLADGGVEVVVDPVDAVVVKPSVMFLAIPEGQLSGDTCPPRMGGHLAAATGSSSFFSDEESSLLSSSVRLPRSLYSFLIILLLFSSGSSPKSSSVFQSD